MGEESRRDFTETQFEPTVIVNRPCDEEPQRKKRRRREPSLGFARKQGKYSQRRESSISLTILQRQAITNANNTNKHKCADEMEIDSQIEAMLNAQFGEPEPINKANNNNQTTNGYVSDDSSVIILDDDWKQNDVCFDRNEFWRNIQMGPSEMTFKIKKKRSWPKKVKIKNNNPKGSRFPKVHCKIDWKCDKNKNVSAMIKNIAFYQKVSSETKAHIRLDVKKKFIVKHGRHALRRREAELWIDLMAKNNGKIDKTQRPIKIL